METTKRKYQKHKNDIKIAIKYVSNKGLKGGVDPQSGKLVYPVYVRVTVKRQFTKFPSRLNWRMAPENLENNLDHSLLKAFVQNETEIIAQTIRQFTPQDKANFALSTWSAYYQLGLVNVFDCISEVLSRRITHTLIHQYSWEQSEIAKLDKSASFSLPMLAKLGVVEAQSLLEEYGILFQVMKYESKIKSTNRTSFKYCLWDCLSGFYQGQITQVLDVEPNLFISKLNIITQEAASYRDIKL